MEKIVHVSIDDIEDGVDEELAEEQMAPQQQHEWVRVRASEMKGQNWQKEVIHKYSKSHCAKAGQSKVQDVHGPKSASGMAEQHQQQQPGQQDSSARLDKYKQILKKAKNNFHSKSEVPP